ncbi:MAG: hypothetical protein ABSA71_04270 [Desulfomonilia bacterium]
MFQEEIEEMLKRKVKHGKKERPKKKRDNGLWPHFYFLPFAF